MRAILFSCAAILVGCGGANVSIDDGGSGDGSSDGSSGDGSMQQDGGGGDGATSDGGTFACLSKMCKHGTEFCRITSGGAVMLDGGNGTPSCVPLPQNCNTCPCLPKVGLICQCSADADGNLTQTCSTQ